MSYDLYCYKSKSSTLTVEEAERFIDTLEDPNRNQGKISTVIQDRVVTALIDANPRFEKFDLDYAAIAEFKNYTIEEAKAQYTYAELNLPIGHSPIQISVEDDYVYISIPPSSENEEALFKELNSYLKVIKKTAGYCVYDPQIQIVFDPEKEELDGYGCS